MKAAVIALMAVAVATIRVEAATLVCEGEIFIPCSTIPFALPQFERRRYGSCGAQPFQVSGIVIQITENRAPPCGTGFFTSCGTVKITGEDLISGEYDRWQGRSVDDEMIFFNQVLDSDSGITGYVARGGINRITGEISIRELIKESSRGGWKFYGTCERRERLF